MPPFQPPQPQHVFYPPADSAARLANAWPEKNGGWRGKCPAHNGTSDNSLVISIGQQGETLLYCHAGCTAPAIVTALQLTLQNLFPTPSSQSSGPVPRKGKRTGGKIVAEYDYTDTQGTLLYQNVRMLYPDGSKDFFQRKPGPTGAWINNISGITPVLYHLPKLLQAMGAGDAIHLCEGEKDVHTLEALGLVATTNSAGANAWRDDYALVLQGASVFLFEDNDDAGRTRTATVGTSLHGKAASVRVVRLPGLLEHGDVSDWLAMRHTQADLMAELDQAPEWQPATPTAAPPPQQAAPEPLRRPIPPAQPYPLDALGSLLTPVALAMQHAVQAPDAIVGQSLLAAACLAVQGHADVLVDGRQYPISEFFLSLAESGDRKSECDRQALRPHREWMKQARQEYEPREKAYRDEMAINKKERDAILNSKETPEAKTEKLKKLVDPLSPPFPMLLCTEPTFEGLQKLYLTALPSLGLFSDEGGRMLGGHSLSEENRVKTIAGLSGLWDGKGIDRVRVGDGNAYLPGVRLAVHLMLQPIVAQRALADPLYQHQGFLGRCLMAWPASLAGTRTYNHVDLSADPHYMQYTAVMARILDSALPVDPEDARNLNPRQLTLIPDAKARWVDFYNHVETQQTDDGPLASVRSFASKAAEHCLRLAGVLTLVDDFDAQEIDEQAVDNAIALTEFYLSEAVRLHGVGATAPGVLLAERLLEWLQDKYGSDLFLLQDVYQRGPARALQDRRGAQAIIGILIDHGYAERIDNPGVVDGKKRRTAYRLLPTP